MLRFSSPCSVRQFTDNRLSWYEIEGWTDKQADGEWTERWVDKQTYN